VGDMALAGEEGAALGETFTK